MYIRRVGQRKNFEVNQEEEQRREQSKDLRSGQASPMQHVLFAGEGYRSTACS